MAKPELLGEVKKLISMGKEKGFLTYDELNNTLPAEVVSSEQFGSIMMMFGEMDIEIVDSGSSAVRSGVLSRVQGQDSGINIDQYEAIVEEAGDCGTNAAACSGDDCHLSFETDHAGFSFTVSSAG